MTPKVWICLSCLALSALLFGSAGTSGTANRVLANPGEVKWQNSANGSESSTLREDPKSGATDLFARYPAGYVFPPHWHASNERIVLIEGRLSIEENDSQHFIEPGGYAYLPARQVQVMTCASHTRCSFYVSWDGPLESHPATQTP